MTQEQREKAEALMKGLDPETLELFREHLTEPTPLQSFSQNMEQRQNYMSESLSLKRDILVEIREIKKMEQHRNGHLAKIAEELRKIAGRK